MRKKKREGGVLTQRESGRKKKGRRKRERLEQIKKKTFSHVPDTPGKKEGLCPQGKRRKKETKAAIYAVRKKKGEVISSRFEGPEGGILTGEGRF